MWKYNIKKCIVDSSINTINKLDILYMKKNRDELAKTLDADKFFENEEKRRKWFMRELRAIAEAEKLLFDILDKDEKDL